MAPNLSSQSFVLSPRIIAQSLEAFWLRLEPWLKPGSFTASRSSRLRMSLARISASASVAIADLALLN